MSHLSHQARPQIVQLTPPGRGAVATCLVIGTGAAELVAARLQLKNGHCLTALPPGRIALAQWLGSQPEEVIVARRAAGDVTIHCHGGRVPIATIMADLAADGGEITDWRQWAATCGDAMTGDAMTGDDPIAAEALTALANTSTERCAAILLDQFHGALTQELRQLVSLLNGQQQNAVLERLAALLANARLGLHLDAPWQVVICGAPNVGKSSLINALVGYGRAIVAPQPGTTRDVVSAITAVDGWPVELSDTAGFRESDDSLETAGIAAAQRRLATADLQIQVFDRSAPWDLAPGTVPIFGNQKWDCPLPTAFAAQEHHAATAPIIVHNKSDLAPHSDARPSGIEVSALRRDGLDKLLAAISKRLVPTPPVAGSPVPFRPHHIKAISAASESLTSGETGKAREMLQQLLGHGKVAAPSSTSPRGGP